MFRWKSVTAAVAVAALALTGCSAGGGGGDSEESGDSTLTLGLIVQATTFEAAGMNFANESPYGQAVYDTLLKEDPSGELLPSLATEWVYNDDNTVLTLKLRDDVTVRVSPV